MTIRNIVEIYVDGACSPNPGRGGWGAVLECGEQSKELWGPQENPESFEHETNNRMEIMAAIKALQALKRPCDVTLYSDSQYLINTMTRDWARRVSKDLWLALDRAASPHKPIEWVYLPREHEKLLRPHALANRGIR